MLDNDTACANDAAGVDYDAALDVELHENDAGAPDVRSYLASLLETLLNEEEGFSGKRPFGNSGWIHDLRGPLQDAGYPVDQPGFWGELVDEMCGVISTTLPDAAEDEEDG